MHMMLNNKNNKHGLTLITSLISGLLLLLISEFAYADYPLSSLHGKIVLNEVLVKQSAGTTIAENDEFIELYNAGTVAINLTQLRLIDGNLFTNELDGTVGSITGNTSAFNFSCTGSQVCEGSALLQPQTYAVVWVGQKGANTTAAYASFQAWLRGAPKLNDGGDDLWLYEQTATGLTLVDYMSFGSGSAVNNNPPLFWDFTYNTALSSAAKGQSVSLSPNGQLSSSACWEMTTSGNASSTCSNYLPTLDSDHVGSRLTSVGTMNTRLHFISGRVFHDVNVNGLDNSEAGLGNVAVTLYDPTSASCRTTHTDALGRYRFAELTSGNYIVYETVASTNCPPVARDPTGYGSSSANQLAVTLAHQSITGLNFADVRMPSFITDNSRVIQPNSVALHPHRFQTYTSGNVSFNLVDEWADPLLPWASQLFRDINCNQDLDAADTVLNASINVAANETVCLLVKVISPANITSGAQHKLSLQSEFVFGDGSLLTIPNSQVRTDLTRVLAGLQGAGNLVLIKSVWNLTRNVAGTAAKPNEILRYTLHYANSGNGSLNDLILHDTLPEFTSLLGMPQCVTTPSSLGSCQAIVQGDALVWQFSGQLLAGEHGVVKFEVQVQ